MLDGDIDVKRVDGCHLQSVALLPSVNCEREVGTHQLPSRPGGDDKDSVGVCCEVQCHNKLVGAVICDNPQNSCCAEHQAVMSVNCKLRQTEVYEDPSLEWITSSGVETVTAGPVRLHVGGCTLHEPPILSDLPVTVKADNSGKILGSVENNDTFSYCDTPAIEIKKDIVDDCDDVLDHIILKERQRMLLSRKFLRLGNPIPEHGSLGLSDMREHSAGMAKEEHCGRPATEIKKVILDDGDDVLDHVVLKERQRMLRSRKFLGLANHIQECSLGLSDVREHSAGRAMEQHCSAFGDLLKTGDQVKGIPPEFQESNSTLPPNGLLEECRSSEGESFMPVKNDNLFNPTLPSSFNVKDEPCDDNDFVNNGNNAVDKISFNLPAVKCEPEVLNKCYNNQTEHMPLQDRMMCLTSRDDSKLNASPSYSCLERSVHSSLNKSTILLGFTEPMSVKRHRKRRKTATDSIETAMEEDAPGLLQILKDRGVLVDEIKLYGEAEIDEALDQSLCEDNFSELEAVISKLFSQRQSFLKFAPMRCNKASRASYCLACLFSLVEQARYLQFRKWPVEWGWCRDLQSFIFVFERHNRLVLERPEYGYATYFFELVDSLPVGWQIKRLVTAMKLTSCGRISLIENKALKVGEDLAEGEAKVLIEYGWLPDTGLGTMLNYCDRVVHDRKNEKDISEWRLKIGKLLVDGYNGGTKVATDIPKRLLDFSGAQADTRFKLEFD